MATIEFADISKVYDGDVRAVSGLDLSIADGEFVVLVGPSGCGKTTALRMVAGLERITSGEIRVGGIRVNDVAPRDRDIAMVFQSYALYPHMNVRDNIGFGLRVRARRKDRASITGRTRRYEPRAARSPRAQAQPTLRRPTAAGRHGEGDRARAEGISDGRAAVEPRRDASAFRCARRSRASSESWE